MPEPPHPPTVAREKTLRNMVMILRGALQDMRAYVRGDADARIVAVLNKTDPDAPPTLG